MRAYAHMARDSKLIAYATELRKRAERRLGEMMAAQPKATGHFAGSTPGANDGSTAVRGVAKTPPISLDQAGIDKNLAKRVRTPPSCANAPSARLGEMMAAQDLSRFPPGR
jgi:hypothetical protein